MLNSGIAPLDREIQSGSFGAIGYDNKSVITRLFMHTAHKLVLQSLNCMIFMPRSTTLDQIVQKYKPANQSPNTPRNGFLHTIYDFDADLQTFKTTTPLTHGSIKAVWDYIRQHPYGGNTHLFIFQFSDRQSAEVYKDLKYLHSRIGGAAFLVATPSEPPLNTFDYSIFCQETAAACRLRVLSGKNSGLPGGVAGPWENLEVDPTTNFWFSALAQPQTLTLESVTARLYDLSSFDAQQKNPAEVKALLLRWKELTKSPRSRPTFMS